MTEQELQDYLAEKMEGGLYAHIWVTPNIGAKEFLISKDYYTVKDGKVCSIEGKRLVPSGDTLTKLGMECRRIGRFNPIKNYERKFKSMTYAEIQTALL